MEEQVGKLVGNLLAADGEIFFPGVGSLRTERRAAKRLNRKLVEPPCRKVVFSSQETGVSLVDQLALVMRDSGRVEHPEEAAVAVYDRWLTRARHEQRLLIEGVGVLEYKHFVLDETFDRRLNPQGHEPVRLPVRRRFEWPLWCGVAAMIVALAYGGWMFYLYYAERSQQTGSSTLSATAGSIVSEKDLCAETGPGEDDSVQMVSVPVASSEGNVSATVVGSDNRAVVVSSGTDTPVPAASDIDELMKPVRLSSGIHYVVLGVFSSLDNAQRALRRTVKEEPAFDCHIYYYGSKYMLSPFASEKQAVCATFVRAHDVIYPGMWVYRAR